MKRKKIIFGIVVALLVNIVAIAGLYNWWTHKHLKAQESLSLGVATTGSDVVVPEMRHVQVPFEEQTTLWLAEMETESIEILLQKLTDAAEYRGMITSTGSSAFATEELRERDYYSLDFSVILNNLRFRKAYEVLQQTDQKKAAELLTKNIRENLAALRIMFQEDINAIVLGRHKGNGISITIMVIPDPNSYRYSSHPDYPPTRLGRRYAV
jgi:hypothetical protein